MNRRHHLSSALLAAALVLGALEARAATSPLWGDLKPGPHGAGYKTIFTYDLSRPPVISSSGDDKRGPRAPGRQMQINVWYPAKVRRGARPLVFEEYARLLLQETDFTTKEAVPQEAVIKKFMENPVELGGKADNIEGRLPALLAMQTGAFKDAAPVAGRFPLIVFPLFRSPALQSVMAEYLASHGFVVAAVGMKGTHDDEPEITVAGLETQITDVQFVVAALRAMPWVDGERLGLISVGIGATSCFGLQMRNTEVDAVVSLDGGIITPFEDRMLKRMTYFDLSAIRVPLLFIHSPHPNVDPKLIDQYRYAARHVVHFPRMSEFHYLNYGMFERFVPGIIGDPPGDTKTGYEWAARYVLQFFGAYLKGEHDSLAFMDKSPEANGVPAGLASAQSMAAIQAPPPLPELKAIFRKEGIAGVVAVFRRLRERDPQPFGPEKLVEFFNWVSFGRDPDWKARREIALLRVESYPDSARAHLTLANVAVQLKDNELARRHFNEALRLVETDPDPLLDYATRRRIEQTAKQSLKNLEG